MDEDKRVKLKLLGYHLLIWFLFIIGSFVFYFLNLFLIFLQFIIYIPLEVLTKTIEIFVAEIPWKIYVYSFIATNLTPVGLRLYLLSWSITGYFASLIYFFIRKYKTIEIKRRLMFFILVITFTIAVIFVHFFIIFSMINAAKPIENPNINEIQDFVPSSINDVNIYISPNGRYFTLWTNDEENQKHLIIYDVEERKIERDIPYELLFGWYTSFEYPRIGWNSGSNAILFPTKDGLRIYSLEKLMITPETRIVEDSEKAYDFLMQGDVRRSYGWIGNDKIFYGCVLYTKDKLLEDSRICTLDLTTNTKRISKETIDFYNGLGRSLEGLYKFSQNNSIIFYNLNSMSLFPEIMTEMSAEEILDLKIPKSTGDIFLIEKDDNLTLGDLKNEVMYDVAKFKKVSTHLYEELLTRNKERGLLALRYTTGEAATSSGDKNYDNLIIVSDEGQYLLVINSPNFDIRKIWFYKDNLYFLQGNESSTKLKSLSLSKLNFEEKLKISSINNNYWKKEEIKNCKEKECAINEAEKNLYTICTLFEDEIAIECLKNVKLESMKIPKKYDAHEHICNLLMYNYNIEPTQLNNCSKRIDIPEKFIVKN